MGILIMDPDKSEPHIAAEGYVNDYIRALVSEPTWRVPEDAQRPLLVRR
jgi:hypothetical protein